MNMQRREDLRDLEEDLGYLFENPALLDLALTHTSWSNEAGPEASDNERLEFLGDSVVDLCVAHMLHEIKPALNEGDMTKLRAYLVKEPTLAILARSFGIGEHIKLGKGERRSGGTDKDSILANAFEALIAAIYLDGGFAMAFEFVNSIFHPILAETGSDVKQLDYKTRLQEHCQAKYQKSPTYKHVSESGPDHAKTFEVEILVGKRLLGHGAGKSKKDAEQAAARDALSLLK